MRPGPSKQFDPERALEQARDLFWRRGYDGTGIAELEATLGIGRKSLYDTFGGKRALGRIIRSTLPWSCLAELEAGP